VRTQDGRVSEVSRCRTRVAENATGVRISSKRSNGWVTAVDYDDLSLALEAKRAADRFGAHHISLFIRYTLWSWLVSAKNR
jgi:hypothetical protein